MVSYRFSFSQIAPFFFLLTERPFRSPVSAELVNKVAYLVFDRAGGKGTRPAAGFF